MAIARELPSVVDVNKALLDILEIPVDQQRFVSKVVVTITPDDYPIVVITQLMADLPEPMESTIEFELRGKDDNERTV